MVSDALKIYQDANYGRTAGCPIKNPRNLGDDTLGYVGTHQRTDFARPQSVAHSASCRPRVLWRLSAALMNIQEAAGQGAQVQGNSSQMKIVVLP